ncbi:MAG: hypothetical protein C5B59_06080 [Bacteroidetes bacterium]|nr:MAG: hypothetical protein C5B59_06080 [Bacteroidota bacterium]
MDMEEKDWIQKTLNKNQVLNRAKHKRCRLSVFVSIFIGIVICFQLFSPVYSQIPKSASEGIVTESLESAGIDSTLLDKMTAAIESNEYPNIHSVLILSNGKLVYEHYFPGKDEIWGHPIGIVNHDRDSLHDMRSASKSVVSACIGIAIGKGLIRNENENIWKFFPEYADLDSGDKAKLTLKDLLTMSSGLDWDESISYNDPTNSEIQMDYSIDPIRYVLSRPLAHPIGAVWNYNGGGTEVLAAVIHKVDFILMLLQSNICSSQLELHITIGRNCHPKAPINRYLRLPQG